MSDDLERLLGDVPGARTRDLVPRLRRRESQNVTYLGDDFPVFWESAHGANVTDVDGNRYIDLTSAFGVASIGHSHPDVLAAITAQAQHLVHSMGDVHPSEVRTRLLEKLAAILPAGLDKAFLATSGSEAVEAALKTAVLATGRSHFIAFRNAYHGLSLGALVVSGLEKFRAPFAALVPEACTLVAYPPEGTIDDVAAVLMRRDDVAAVIIEPIQGRGGCIVPPDGYLPQLRALCDERGVLLILDEIYTGFGRTGTMFACEREAVTPDIICIGKAMGAGVPISAAVARAHIMDAWPPSRGEALHTSTYLGNPLGCAAALAAIGVVEREHLAERARVLEAVVADRAEDLFERGVVMAARGRGLMWGLQLRDGEHADRTVKRALAKGLILLQAGPSGDVLSITPPLVISEAQLHRAFDIIDEVL
jgi:4-aminobutyrate aminotransferase-like enzyme